jgi:hypothetical protein
VGRGRGAPAAYFADASSDAHIPLLEPAHAEERAMKARTVALPDLAMIAGTRAALGAGLALLLADRLAPAERRAVGWTLFAVGALTTIPLVAGIVSRSRRIEETARLEGRSPLERGMTEATDSP